MLPRMSANPVPEQSEAKHEDTKASDLASILERMKKAQLQSGAPSYEKRVERLDKLLKGMLTHKDAIVAAISEDFGHRSKHESLIADVFTTINAIKHCRAHLHEWMEVEPRPISRPAAVAAFMLVGAHMGFIQVAAGLFTMAVGTPR